jgi:TatD DNase family protein
MRLIDSHCHPQLSDYDGDRAEMLERAFAAEIGMVAIGTTLIDSLAGIRLAEEYQDRPMWVAVGVHPTDDDSGEFRIADLEALVHHPQVVAIGETGLDFFHLKPEDSPQEQIDLFEQQIILAQQSALPLVIHCRDRNGAFEAYDEVLRLLVRHQVDRFVMHCYSGNWEYAEKFLELGGLLSFTGIATFPKSEEMQEVIERVPEDRFMIETDAPFLAPVPHRGKRNEPLYVELVAEKIAEIRGISVDDIARLATENTQRFFQLP